MTFPRCEFPYPCTCDSCTSANTRARKETALSLADIEKALGKLKEAESKIEPWLVSSRSVVMSKGHYERLRSIIPIAIDPDKYPVTYMGMSIRISSALPDNCIVFLDQKGEIVKILMVAS